MKNPIFISVALLCICSTLCAQKFWLTTYEFPGGPKTGIAGIKDTCLIAGLTYGVLRSFDEGQDWDSVLLSGPVYTVHATDEGVVLAGGAGKIYVSTDYGTHWDSVDLNHNYLVTRFAHTSDGDLFAITGNLDINLGFVGAGVFYSADNGVTWTPRNNGLGAYLSCDQIATDKHDRVYLTVKDELSDGPGGLYVSNDDGLHWQHVDIVIDGDGVIEPDIDVSDTRGLSVSPQDTLYISLEGSAGTVFVRLNLCRHIDDLFTGGDWKLLDIWDGSSWWLDPTLHGIHFARNGDFYSSIPGTPSQGGTWFKRKNSATWNQQLQGLGYDVSGFYNTQFFAEKSSGKVFMVQYLDERIYWADTSLTTPVVNLPPAPEERMRIYPNPVKINEKVRIFLDGNRESGWIYTFDLTGKMISRKFVQGTEFEAPPTGRAGIYFLRFGNHTAKLVVDGT